MVRKILLVQLRQLGDILLTTPIIRALHNIDPNAEISFLAHTMGSLILENNPLLQNIFYYSEKSSSIKQLHLLHRLRKEKFTEVVDFMNNPRSALMTVATGARVRAGFRGARRWAYNRTLPRAPSATYIVREKLQLLNILDHPQRSRDPVDLVPMIPFFNSDSTKPLDFLRRMTKVEVPRIILSPTHRREERRWPLASYAALADYLTQTFKAQVLWLWGPGEEALVDQCHTLCRQKTLKAPQTSFREMTALIANSDLFIGNSNGPSHVAIGVMTPSLQLHGPTNGQSWCPDSKIHRYIQGLSMNEVTVEKVIIEVQNIWESVMEHTGQRVQGGEISQWSLVNPR